MGSGKSSVGRLLANQMKLEFVDLDAYLEEKFETSISDFFKQFGEDRFRKEEQIALQYLLSLEEELIIACGGGTASYFNNMDLMLEKTVCVYLAAEPKFLYKRLQHSKHNRPLISGLSDRQLYDYIAQLLEKREVDYERAHIRASAVNAKREIKTLKELIADYRK